MDTVASLKDGPIPVILEPTKLAFVKVLESRRSEIESHPHQTFRYGNTERHQLDVYYPDPAVVSSGSPVPVLFFIYGGGFVTGDRRQNPPFDLAYTNLGVFFAKRGFLTVIPDYRLYPSATYPGPAEDVRDALAWVLSNASTITSPSLSTLPPSTPLNNLFALSHSAGSTLLTSIYLSPTILPLDSPIRAATRGLIPKGGMYAFKFPDSLMPAELLEGFYGSQVAALANMPLALLKAAPAEVLEALPEFFVLKSEWEPAPVYESSDAFVEALEGRLGRKVRYEDMKGHSHVSPQFALLSGAGEEWADDVVGWVRARV